MARPPLTPDHSQPPFGHSIANLSLFAPASAEAHPVQRFVDGGGALESLIPGWVKGALDALRGDARSQESSMQERGGSDEARLSSAAQKQGGVMTQEGQAQRMAIQGDGQECSATLTRDGQTQGQDIQADFASTEQEAQAFQADLTAQVQAQTLVIQGEAEQVRGEAEQRWRALEQDAQQTMQGLNDQATGPAPLCSSRPRPIWTISIRCLPTPQRAGSRSRILLRVPGTGCTSRPSR